MKDLTKGLPAKVILFFTIPLFLGNLLQQLYNMTDSKIVSNYVGTNALAAVGATAVVFNTLMGFINSLTQGFGILVARAFGAKDEPKMRRYVAGAVMLTVIFTVVFEILGECVIEDILILLKTPADIMPLAVAYVRIIIIGLAFTSLYNLCANIVRALGDSTTPLVCLIIGVVVNIGLDLLFVGPLAMGIKGAAYATVIAQMVSSCSCMIYMITHYKNVLPQKTDYNVDGTEISLLLTTGLSMAFMICLVNFGTIILQSAINSLGTVYVTAHTAGRRVLDIFMAMIYTFGFAMTTYVSQNIGAQQGRRVRQGMRQASYIVTGITTVLIFIVFFFGRGLVTWVASTRDEQIVSTGVLYIRIGVCFFYVLGELFILRCSLQGMGKRIITLVSSFIELAVKIFSAFWLVKVLGYLGVALTEPISWVVMTIPLAIVYFKEIKNLNALTGEVGA